MVLEVTLTAIFGRDYGQVAPHFGILSDETVRDLQFARAFRMLGNIVVEVAARRRAENTNATDILGMLMAARDRGSGRAMPDRQLVNEIMTLIVAGHETTAGTICFHSTRMPRRGCRANWAGCAQARFPALPSCRSLPTRARSSTRRCGCIRRSG
jgi:cytochrome P450